MRGRSGVTGRHRGALAAGLAALALLAGCAAQLGQVRTDNAMYAAGYADDAVTWQTAGGVTTVDATADPKAPHAPLDTQAQAVAKAIWDSLPGRFGRLTVTIRGVGTLTFTHDQLAALFGPRPGTLDQESLSAGASDDASVLGLVGVGALFFVGCVVVYSATRYRRLRARTAASRTALLMATIPQELWDTAEAPDALTVGPIPPPPVPAPPPRASSSGPPVPPPPPPTAATTASPVAPPVHPGGPPAVPPPAAPRPATPPRPGPRDHPAP